MLRCLKLCLVLVLAGLVGCAEGSVPGASGVQPSTAVPTAKTRADLVAHMHALGVDQYLDQIEPVTESTRGEWTAYHYDVTAGAACITGSEYLAAVRKSRTQSRDVVLYLQGGGACWDATTCSGLPLAKQDADTPEDYSSGIFDHAHPGNPLREWNMVFASYCDGSVFSGDNVVAYNGVQKYHWGLRNLSAAVTQMRRQFPDPERILVTGSSAGGFGTMMGMGVVRMAYPEAELMVFNDSGPALENKDGVPGMAEDLRAHWQFEQFMPEDCARCDEQLYYLVSHVLDRDPSMRAAFFSYRNDIVIGSIFLRMFGEYPETLRSLTEELHAYHPDRFKRLLIEGQEHTILGSDALYGEYNYGITTAEWLRQFVENSPDWTDYP